MTGAAVFAPRAAQRRTGGQILPGPGIRTPVQASEQEGRHGTGLRRRRGAVFLVTDGAIF